MKLKKSNKKDGFIKDEKIYENNMISFHFWESVEALSCGGVSLSTHSINDALELCPKISTWGCYAIWREYFNTTKCVISPSIVGELSCLFSLGSVFDTNSLHMMLNEYIKI